MCVLIAPSLRSSASVEVVIEADPKDEAFELDASRHSVADQISESRIVRHSNPQDRMSALGQKRTLPIATPTLPVVVAHNKGRRVVLRQTSSTAAATQQTK